MEVEENLYEKSIYTLVLMHYHNFVISPWKRMWSFIFTNLNCLYWRMIVTSFRGYKDVNVQDQFLFTFHSVDLSFRNYLALHKGVAFQFSDTEEWWVPSLVENGQVVLYEINNTCNTMLNVYASNGDEKANERQQTNFDPQKAQKCFDSSKLRMRFPVTAGVARFCLKT